MTNEKILVIGDSCLDVFVYCAATRLAPDLPVPVLTVENSVENGGMAKNLHRNLLSRATADIVTNSNWPSIKKTRYVHSITNHTFFRVDTDDKIERINLKSVKLKNYGLIAISDYCKGFLHESDIQWICENHPLVFVDTKKILGDWIKSAKFIKINDVEYNASISKITPELDAKIIHTRGGAGADFQGINYPIIDPVEVRDSSGAGDSFMAGLILEYIKSKNITKAIMFANECASEAVKHKGVTVI